MNDTVFLT